MSTFSWIATLTGVCALALTSAHYVRYNVVEPIAMGAFCESASAHGKCVLRQVVITLLSENRLGWLSVSVAALSMVLRIASLGWCAWFLATASFVLYSAELAAPALLLAGLTLTRVRFAAHNGR
jgi:hypothetical protein